MPTSEALGSVIVVSIGGLDNPKVAVFGKPKANGKGALNPEYEPLAPNRLRDRADFPEGEIHIRKEKRFSWTFFFVEECF